MLACYLNVYHIQRSIVTFFKVSHLCCRQDYVQEINDFFPPTFPVLVTLERQTPSPSVYGTIRRFTKSKVQVFLAVSASCPTQSTDLKTQAVSLALKFPLCVSLCLIWSCLLVYFCFLNLKFKYSIIGERCAAFIKYKMNTVVAELQPGGYVSRSSCSSNIPSLAQTQICGPDQVSQRKETNNVSPLCLFF